MLHRLSRVLRPPQQQCVRSGRRTQSQLVHRQTFTSSSLNPGTGGGGKSESGDAQLGHGQEPVVVGDGSDDDDRLTGLGSVLIGGYRGNAGERHGGSVDARHEQSAEDGLVEGGVGTACSDKIRC